MLTIRLHAALAAAALSATAFGSLLSPSSADADLAKELPPAGCQTYTSPSGDAKAEGLAQAPNDADLDITAVTLRTTATHLVAYVKVNDLQNGPSTTDGHRFSVSFDYGGHTFALSGSAYKNGTGTIRDTLAMSGEAGHTTQLGVDVPGVLDVPPKVDKGFKTSGLKATFDTTNNFVVMDVPITDILKYAGTGSFTGKLTSIVVTAGIDDYAVSSTFDTATAPAAWNIGDNKCFSVATKIGLTVAKFPATRNVTAKLTTASGQPLGGKAVTFLLNGKKFATVITAGNGTATVKNLKPGYTVTAQFAAAAGYLASSASTKI